MKLEKVQSWSCLLDEECNTDRAECETRESGNRRNAREGRRIDGRHKCNMSLSGSF